MSVCWEESEIGCAIAVLAVVVRNGAGDCLLQKEGCFYHTSFSGEGDGWPKGAETSGLFDFVNLTIDEK